MRLGAVSRSFCCCQWTRTRTWPHAHRSSNGAVLGTPARTRGSRRFTLVGIARNGNKPGDYQNAYVHAKIALIDDVWATIGSANIANRSFYGDTELNASFWHRPTVTELRRDLLLEHLGQDTAELDDIHTLRLYARIARGTRNGASRGEPLEGLAFALDPRAYATWRSTSRCRLAPLNDPVEGDRAGGMTAPIDQRVIRVLTKIPPSEQNSHGRIYMSVAYVVSLT